MALDGAYLRLVKNELMFLVGARVDKIHQPTREELVMSLRYRGGVSKILISAHADSARVHITENDIGNPMTPPMFCMLMRKHLSGAKLLDIRQDGLERILFMDFEAVNELGDLVKLTAAVEIMGKYSNMILINENGKIIDSLKRVDAQMSRARLVLPGMTYELPPREGRIIFTDAGENELRAKFSGFKTGKLVKFIIGNFEGVSPLLAREWVFFACKDTEIDFSGMTSDIEDKLVYIIKKTAKMLETGEASYSILKTKDGIPKDFAFIYISQYGGQMISYKTESACQTLDKYYVSRDDELRIRQRANDLFRLLSGLNDRIAKRTVNQRDELLLCEKKDEYKLKGDLLSANVYMISKGDKSVRVQNFYDEALPEMVISLDERLTPSQNVQKYYHEYKKLVTAEKKLTEQIEKGEKELDYIESVFDSLTRARTDADIIELRIELVEQGYIKNAKMKGKAPKEQPPLRFKTSDGMEVLVGRNNKQNDRLTLKTAEKTDIWLHTQGIHGSHVILCTKGEDPTDESLNEAAVLAAFHSKGKTSSQVPVDYTMVKYVKKPAGAKPGMVIFTNNRTLYVKPDEELVNKLKAGK